ncbi:hypothetical protein B0H34DRAFT_655042 [Crassisporium funariophilum]|nr:hypothetical protein B0H34DRAFT_655042 [Crassisporium funariophilum]
MDRDSPPPPPPPNPFPYPKNANPTPHQIFHLNMGASQAEIKARYYDLVRTHHPDSFHTRLIHPSEAHARFRSIQAAYDFLRGRTLSPNPNASPSPSPNNFDPYMHELARRRRAHYASRQGYDTHNDRPGWGAGFGAPASERDDWNGGGRKERVILFFGVMVRLYIFLFS